MAKKGVPQPIVVAIALSLYRYNVSPVDRVRKLYEHFEGYCAELDELISLLIHRSGFEVTELALPTALAYVQHAMETYGQEAADRVSADLGLPPDSQKFMSDFLKGRDPK